MVWSRTSLVWLLLIGGCGQVPSDTPSAVVSTPQTAEQTATVQNSDDQKAITAKSATKPAEGVRLQFQDATSDWGLKFTRFDDMRGLNRIQEALGGGAALFDLDLDGRLDVMMTQGCRLPLKEMTAEYTNECFRNTGHLQRITPQAGLSAAGYFTGCAAADFNEDGYPDVYLSAYGHSKLMQNNGDGTFRDVSEISHAAITTWSTSCAWSDVNGDGLLDLFVGTYAIAADDPPLLCKEPKSPSGTTSCLPILFPAADDFLLVNDGRGGFVDVTRDAGIDGRDGRAQGVLAVDLTGDGRCDIYVANDTTPSFLYVNETAVDTPTLVPGTDVIMPRFVERGIEFAVAMNGEGKATAAMGIAHGDYDRDGWTDLHITNFFLETNTLFRNLNGKGFVDLSSASRLGPPSRFTLAFGTEFLDVDHDGWLDLFVSTGHIENRSWLKEEPYRMKPHLFRNERNGRFTDVAATAGPYFASAWVGRGLAIGDIDRDGDLDAVVAHQVDPSVLLLNETPAHGTSIIVKPIGRERSPRSGIGTRMTAVGITPTLTRDLAGGGSFLSTSAEEIHLGLGPHKEVEQLELAWADGQIDRWPHVTPGYYVAVQGQGLIKVTSERP